MVAISGSTGKLPPGPGAPAVVQSVRYYRDPYGYMQACWRKYGDWFTVRQIPCGTIVYVADPEAIRSIFADPGTHRVAPINAYMAPVLGEGLLLLDGEAHARERKWISTSLAPERMRWIVEVITALTEVELQTWPVGEPFALRPRFETLTLRVILRLLFGAAGAERADRIAPLIVKLKSKDLVQSVLASLPFGLATWRLSGEATRTLAAVEREIYAELAGRRAETLPNEGVLAGLLAPLRDGTQPADRAIRDQIMTLIFAGHETVSSTLAWTFERLVRHGAAMQSVREAVASGDERFPEAVLLETMRQRTTIADVGRELTSDVELGERRVPAGTRVCPAISLVHMRPDVFPDPEAFRPERFFDAARQRPWLYLPFGGGVRKCVGEAFAMLEMQTIMTAIVRRTTLRGHERAAERGISNGVTIYPHKGAVVVMEARN